MTKAKSTIKTWADADEQLRELGMHEFRIERINAKATTAVNEIKEGAEKQLRPLQEQRDRIEAELELFCQEHRGDFAGKRSRRLNFGTVAFRAVAKVKVPDADRTLQLLHERGLTQCINTRQTVNKAELGKQSVAVIREVGADVHKGESFTAKADRTRIEVPEG